MPRPKRPGWSKITLTVSEEVAREIRLQAVERGMEMGTVVDLAIRALPGFPVFPRTQPATSSAGIRKPGHSPAASEAGSNHPASTEHRIGGGQPYRIAAFVVDRLNQRENKPTFLPLKHLALTHRTNGHGISANRFKKLIAASVSESGVTIGSESDTATLRFLNAVIQTADQFFLKLGTPFPQSAARMALWTENAVKAFGTIIGERLVALQKTSDPVKKAPQIAEALTRMVENTQRRQPNLVHRLHTEPPPALVALLTEHETLRPRRQAEDPMESDEDLTKSLLS